MERIIEFVKWSIGVVLSLIFLIWLIFNFIPEMYTMLVLLFSGLILVILPMGALFGILSPLVKKYLDKEKVEKGDWLVGLVATLVGIWLVFYFGVYGHFLTVVEFLTRPVR